MAEAEVMVELTKLDMCNIFKGKKVEILTPMGIMYLYFDKKRWK